MILPEDGYYGSDFAYMIELIYHLLEDYNGGLPESKNVLVITCPKTLPI